MVRLRWLAVLVFLATGLLGARCGDEEAVSLEALRQDVALPFEYSLYCDTAGKLVGERSGILLAHRTAHLEKVYADAQRGEARAQELVRQLEVTARLAGRELADRATGIVCNSLPNCTVKWATLDELIPSRGTGGSRLRTLMAESFSAQARLKGVENAVIAGALDVLLVGSVLKPVGTEARSAAAETRGLSREVAISERAAVAGVEGRLTIEEARLAEAEALEVGARHPASLTALERYRPSVSQPSTGASGPNGLWTDYVAYWTRRYEELAGNRPLPADRTQVPPPLTWEHYSRFRARFQQALEFQRRVSAALSMKAWSADDAIKQLQADAREARTKYGGAVEIRRPGHPLFGRKVVVTRVHLVYDAKGLAPKTREALLDAAPDLGVELHLHGL